MNVLEKIEEGLQKPGNGNGNPDRLYRSGLQDIGFTALRLCSDRRPSFHGKDGVRIESGRSYCSKKRAAVHGIQSGDVEGAVSKPYAGDGVQRRLQKLRTGTLSDSDWDAVVEGIGVIGNSKLIIDDTPGISIMELRSKCRKMKLGVWIQVSNH